MTNGLRRNGFVGRGFIGVGLCLACGLGVVFAACQGRSDAAVMTGTFSQVQGSGRMEFNKDKVYVTTLLGMTFVGAYEIDGNKVIIKGIGGQQVYTLDGDTLDGGAGMKFVRAAEAIKDTTQAGAPSGAPGNP